MIVAAYLGGAVTGLGVLLALWLAARSFLTERADYLRHPPTALSRHPERAGIPELVEVAFPAADGLQLAGWYVPSHNRAALVLVHGTGADRSSLVFEMKVLADADFGVLSLDLPGQGSSTGTTRWGAPERRAITAAVDWLSSQSEIDPRRIGGFGLSMGAYVLTQAAVLDRRLRGVALVSSPNDVVEQNWLAAGKWGLLTQIPCYLALRASGQSLDMRPKDVIGAIAPRPVFILAGGLDTLVPPFMAHQLYAAAGEPKTLWIAPGVHHADFALVAAHEYRDRLIAFFKRSLTD